MDLDARLTFDDYVPTRHSTEALQLATSLAFDHVWCAQPAVDPGNCRRLLLG